MPRRSARFRIDDKGEIAEHEDANRLTPSSARSRLAETFA